MELKRLKHLVALADERNFARAAERVHLSQSALSRSIQAAESELDVRLFDRGTTEVTPTPAGLFVVERARKLLFDSRCLERDIDLYRQKQIGDLAFGAGPFPAATLFPALMSALRRRFPGVRIRMEVNNWNYLAQHCRNEELDFFVADTSDLPLSEDLQVQMLTRQEGGFYVRRDHPLLRKKKFSPQDLSAYGIASVRLPQKIRLQLAHLLGVDAGSGFPLALECDDVPTLKRTVLGSDTILATIDAAVIAEVKAGDLQQVHLPDVAPLYSEVGIVSLLGRTHSPVAEYVILGLQELAKKLAVDLQAGSHVR